MPATAPARRRPAPRPFPLRTGVAEVRAVATLSPTMVRITFADAGFADFPVEEPGEIITLLWPGEDGEVVLPEQGSWRFPAGKPEPHARNYTVRTHDPATHELAIDFVIHGDHGQASRWAAAARPGDRLGYAGPRTHWTTADDGAAWTLLVADETGLPALAAIAETLPAHQRAIALVEIAGEDCRQPVRCDGRLDLHWVPRDGAPAGETLALADALRVLPLPDGRGRVWGAGESGVMRAVRDHLRDERGIPRADMTVLGYWKHDKTKDWITE